MYKMFVGVMIAAILAAAPAAAESNSYKEFSRRARAEKRESIQALLKTHAPAIVTVKVVVTNEFRGQTSESEREVVGALVSDDGLVVVADSSLDPMGGMVPMVMGGPPGMQMPEPKTRTSDYRIIVGSSTTENEALLVARDSDLDLAWFRITTADEQRFPYLSLDNSATLQVGDSYETIGRLGERFDRAAVIQAGIVIGSVRSPRTLLVAAGGSGPAFSENGQLAGFVVRQPDKDGGGSTLSQTAMLASFILPVDQLAKATTQVRTADKRPEAAGGS